MTWVAVTVQQGHGHGLRPYCLYLLHQPIGLLFRKRLQHLPLRVDSFPHRDNGLVQGLWLLNVQGEKVGTLLGADSQQILETRRHQESHPRPLFLQQGVGALGGAQPHFHGGQLLVRGGAGEHPGGQQGCLLPG